MNFEVYCDERCFSKIKGRFITAYEVTNDESLEKIKNSPDFK